jgi:hypothetical protein
MLHIRRVFRLAKRSGIYNGGLLELSPHPAHEAGRWHLLNRSRSSWHALPRVERMRSRFVFAGRN